MNRSAETEALPLFSMPAENRHLTRLCIKIEADVPPGQLPVELATGCSSSFEIQKLAWTNVSTIPINLASTGVVQV